MPAPAWVGRQEAEAANVSIPSILVTIVFLSGLEPAM